MEPEIREKPDVVSAPHPTADPEPIFVVTENREKEEPSATEPEEPPPVGLIDPRKPHCTEGDL